MNRTSWTVVAVAVVLALLLGFAAGWFSHRASMFSHIRWEVPDTNTSTVTPEDTEGTPADEDQPA